MRDEGEIERLRRKIVELEREKRVAESTQRSTLEFIARTTHEVRNFLNTILGFVDLLRDTPLTAEQKGSVEAVERGGRQLQALANDLLDLANVDVGRRETQRVAFDFVDLVEDVVRAAAVWARGKAIEVRAAIAPGVPHRVIADAQWLRQVLTNLLQNAVKFTEAGEVVVSVERRSPASVELAVRDTGVGIAPDRLHSIFEPFAQADPAVARRHGGSGLGLAISKRLVERMGGTISAASTLGSGTTIRFTLDVEIDSGEEPLRTSQRLAGVGVLVVDDSSERTELCDVLRSFGANVTEIGEGRAALETLRSDRGARHDVVVLAGRMRGMSGLAIVHELRGDRSLLARIVMLLPVDHRRGDLATLHELGVGATVLRPLKRSELLQAIERTVTPLAQNAPQPT